VGLLNPGEAHQDFASLAEREYLTIKIQKPFVRGILQDAGYSRTSFPAFPTAKVDGGRELARVCEAMRREGEQKEWGYEVLLESLVTELSIRLFRQFTPLTAETDLLTRTPKDFRQEVRRALDYLHENYRMDFDLNRLAEAAGLSKYYLDRIFKDATGFRPHAYMTRLRIETAERMLTEGSKAAAEIALDLGFADQSHFSNVFKRHTGVSPQRFRALRRGHKRHQGMD